MTETITHKEWLDNEYAEWVKALSECTVHNFKEHPQVRRMLGEPDPETWKKAQVLWGPTSISDLLFEIDCIGRKVYDTYISYLGVRYIYYAQQILKRNPSSICEIGGGVGQFFATLLALGYQGDYYINDLHEVKAFQRKYLHEVCDQTGIQTYETTGIKYEMLISFYALGEFDDTLKQDYKQFVDVARHGYIAWNPHSGASDSLSIFENHDIKVTPGIEPGISIIEW